MLFGWIFVDVQHSSALRLPTAPSWYESCIDFLAKLSAAKQMRLFHEISDNSFKMINIHYNNVNKPQVDRGVYFPQPAYHFSQQYNETIHHLQFCVEMFPFCYIFSRFLLAVN